MIVQLNGEWAESAPDPMTHEEAVATGCQAFADRQTKGEGRWTRTMISNGLARFIDIPDGLLTFAEHDAEPKLLSDDSFDIVLREQRRHSVRKNWTDGLVTAPEQVLREALDAFWIEEWSMKAPEYRDASAEEREEIRQRHGQFHIPAVGIGRISLFIDFTQCQQTGPVLVVEQDSWRFENPASYTERMPFLVALTDPHYYGYSSGSPYGSWGAAKEQERKDRIANEKQPLREGWRY